MAQQSGSAMTGKPLIESDRVEGTTVYDPSEQHREHQAAHDRKDQRRCCLRGDVVRRLFGDGHGGTCGAEQAHAV